MILWFLTATLRTFRTTKIFLLLFENIFYYKVFYNTGYYLISNYYLWKIFFQDF